MRCPKCGYTSFDNLERCKKCKKNIAAAAAALMGTVASATAPSFLSVAQPAQAQNTVSEASDTEFDLNLDDDATLDFSNEKEELFSLDAHAPAEQTQSSAREFTDDNELDLRLSDHFGENPNPQEAAIDMELDLALGELDETPLALGSAEVSGSTVHPGLDLAGLDISDLQAPEPPAAQEIAFEPTLSLADDSAQAQAAAPSTSRASQADADEFSLEDLQVEGLAEAKPGVPVADDQYQPGMKTGTALDNFNFELDELLELNENEKA